MISFLSHWIISAAHCFCGSVVKCTGDEINFQKIFRQDDEEYQERLRRVSLTFGTLRKETVQGLDTLVIHPSYYSRQTYHDALVGHTDVALIKTIKPVFGINKHGNETDKYPYIVPICLPPKVGYKDDNDQTASGIHEPFEDMDCFIVPGNLKVIRIHCNYCYYRT